MNILHIIPTGSTSILPLAESLQRCDTANSHTFFVTVPFQTVLKKNIELLRIRDLKYMPVFSKFKRIRKALYLYSLTKQADRVVWHTLKTNGGYTPYFLFVFRDVLKKSAWIPCEGEIGNYASVSNKRFDYFAKKVNLYVQRQVRWIGLNYISDKVLLNNFEITKPHIQLLPYTVGECKQNALDLCTSGYEKMVHKNRLFVQLGLSSQVGNNHIKLLSRLRKLKDMKDACYFIPFRFIIPGIRHSNGTQIYMSKVRSTVAKIGIKAIYQDKQVSVEDYINQLSKIDIVILGNRESIQMGMLTCLLAMNKRIFMRNTSPLYQSLNELGAGIHSVEELIDAGSLEAAMQLSASRLPDELLMQYKSETILTLWRDWCSEEKE